VSLLWRDELRVLLSPQRVCLQRRARGLRPSVVEAAAAEVDGSDAFHWAAAVEALAALLKARPKRGADATVIVSNHFARYTLVPASDLLVTREDEVRYAHQDFMRVYGAAAERWHVCVSAANGGGAAVASGIDARLLEALRVVLAAAGLKPRSLQPALMAAFNTARPRLSSDTVRLLCIEPGMAITALLAPGWQRIRSRRMAHSEEIEPIVQRERALDAQPLERETVCVVPVFAGDFAEALSDGTPVQVLPPLWPDVTENSVDTEKAA